MTYAPIMINAASTTKSMMRTQLRPTLATNSPSVAALAALPIGNRWANILR